MTTDVTPLVSRISVVFLHVRDLERSLAFYRDVLGIQFEVEEGWAEARLGEVRFALHVVHEGMQELSAGTVRIDFGVEDADAAAERVGAAGYEVKELVRESWGTAVGIVDPDGYFIQLYQAPA
jgi:predicted enzyme related to lactoylglutathione lyase